MAAKKVFDQIGQRDIRLERVEQHEVKELSTSMCPGCGAGPMDGVTGMQFKTVEPPAGPWDVATIDEDSIGPVYPKHGTPTVCSYCGELCVFRQAGDKLVIEIPTVAEVDEWRLDSTIWRVLDCAQKHFQQKSLEARLRGDMRYAKNKPRRF